MQKQAKQFLFDLLETHSPSGYETPAARVWLDYVGKYADETMTDAYGNAFAVLNPKGSPTVMLDGHSDEIGLMVSYIDDDGYLWVSGVGGIDPKMLPAMRVRVHTAEGPLSGVIGAMAPHMQGAEAREKSPKVTDLYIDIGAADKREAMKLVRVGDTATIEHGPQELLNNTLVARACDNKIGIWSSAEALRQLSSSKGGARIIAAAHIQEEIGLNGARMGAYRWNPDVALVVDVTNATDYPDADPKLRNKIKMGAGPAIRIGPASHPRVAERLEQVAEANKINLQRVPIPTRSGTNANAIYPVREGIPCGILSTPNRYMHSPSETINMKDLEQIPKLMAKFASGLKKSEKFKVHGR